MKQVLRFSFFALILLACVTRVHAQDCATGYCPATIIVHHKAGAVSPVTVNITYGVVKSALSGADKCWITRNLGATTQATSSGDATDASAGWFWQFNRKQGYQLLASVRTPNTTWVTSIVETLDFLPANDPCTLLLGSTWRIPTSTEWTTAGSTNSWGAGGGGSAYAYASVLKIHMAGQISSAGNPSAHGQYGYYWSSTGLGTSSGYVYMSDILSNSNTWQNNAGQSKSNGFTVRCLRSF